MIFLKQYISDGMLYFLACDVLHFLLLTTYQSKDNNYMYFGDEYNDWMKNMMSNLVLIMLCYKEHSTAHQSEGAQ